MSQIYKCDRCGVVEESTEETLRFGRLYYGLRGGSQIKIDLCRHCIQKLEEFLSDPNCMEKEDIHYCGSCEYQFENGICPRTHTCSNDSVACKKWKPKEVDE